MSQKFECGDNGALIGYLYDECAPAERLAIEAHVAICAVCTAELEALDSTRVQLTAWAPPETSLGFRVVPEHTSNLARPFGWWARPLPAWGQAAAALVIFGSGLALGVARGTGPDAGEAVLAGQPPVAVSAPAAVGEVTQDDLAALEARLRAELAEMRVAPAVPSSTPVSTPASATSSDAQILARVRTLIDESEQRQRRELALRTADVVRDIDAQRQFDWVRVQRALGQFEGTAGAEIQRQRQEINNLLQRVSQRP